MKELINQLAATASALLIIILTLIVSLVVALIFLFMLANTKYKCSDFRNSQTAQLAYDLGAKYLDGKDHDKNPCEALPK